MKHNGETTLADVVASIKELGDRWDGRIDSVGERLDRRIDSLGDRLDARIDKLDTNVSKRLDGILKILGGHHRDHERRITALEKSVAALKKTG
jgi:hypothetical protein